MSFVITLCVDIYKRLADAFSFVATAWQCDGGSEIGSGDKNLG